MRRVTKVLPPAAAPELAPPKRATPAVQHTHIHSAPSPAPVPVAEPQMPAAAAEENMETPKPRKLSVLQMANIFALKVEESSPAPSLAPALPPAAPTIKVRNMDSVLKLDGNTVTKNSAPAPSSAEEFGVAVADVALSSGVHGSLLIYMYTRLVLSRALVPTVTIYSVVNICQYLSIFH